MTAVAPIACPIPPPDFALRQVPVVEFNLASSALLRIHRTAYSPLFFNRASTSMTKFRFDAPDDQFGVLYAAPTLSACMFETVIRNRFEGGHLPLMLDYAELEIRSVSSIGLKSARVLELADFTQSLAPLGGNAIVMSTADYAGPNLWSLEIHNHPQRLDGIYFRSRYSGEPCVALFDRVEVTERGRPSPLLASADLDEFLDRFQIAVV